MNVVVLDEAEAEIDSASWYDDRREGLGDEFLEAVVDALDVLGESPHVWPLWPGAPPRIPAIRRFLLRRFPYALGYQAHGENLVVLAVAHESRRPLYWIGRAR